MNTIETTVTERLQHCLPRLARDFAHPARTLGELAIDSIDSVELLCAVHEEFGVRLTEDQFQPHTTIGEFIAAIEKGIQS